MKKSNSKSTGEENPVAPKEDTSKKAREQYRKEVFKSKNKVQGSQVNDDNVENEGEQDDSKFKELKKYLLSDITSQGIKGSSPVKSSTSSPRGNRSPRKKMIDTRTEITPAELHVTASGDGAGDKKSPSPRKKSSPTKKGKQETLIVENGADNTSGKKIRLSKSPESLAVPTPSSPRTGNRQRSPNLRYADDMVMFPLKSPKRQILKKENSENKSNTIVQQSKSPNNLSSECQTSQLYSLLTGTVVNAPTSTGGKIENEKALSKKDKKEEKIVIKSGSKEENNELNEKKGGSEFEEKCENADSNIVPSMELASADNLTNDMNANNDSKSDFKESLNNVPGSPQNSEHDTSMKNDVDINCNSDEKEITSNANSPNDKLDPHEDKMGSANSPDPLANVNKVIEQILVEAVQEETPQWALYDDISEKYKTKPRKMVKLVRDKKAGSKGGLDDDHEDDSLSRDGDDSDDGGKRRLTRPISKSSMIRMTPALGVLVGHDEEGFMVLHKRKKQRGWSKGKAQGTWVPDVVNKDNMEIKIGAGRIPLIKDDSFEKEKSHSNIDSTQKLQSLLPPRTVNATAISKTHSSTVTVSKPVMTQSQIKLIGPQAIVGNAGFVTKATLVSGSQNLPCVLVPASTQKQTLITLPVSSGLTSKSNILIPASPISLMPSSASVRVANPQSQSTNMVSMLQGSSVAIRAAVSTSSSTTQSKVPSPGTQIRTLIAPCSPVSSNGSPRPVQGTVFRLSSSGQLISSSGQPLLSTKVQPGIVGNVPCTQTTLLTNQNSLGVTTSKGLGPSQKVLILKKSDINTSKAISVQVSAVVSSGSISSGQKSPVRSIAPSIQPKIGITSPSEHGHKNSKVGISSPSETGLPAGITSSSANEQTVSKIGVTSTSEAEVSVSITGVTSSETGPQVASNAVNSPPETELTESKQSPPKTPMPKKDNVVLTNLISKIQSHMLLVPELPDCLKDDLHSSSSGTEVEMESDSEEEIDHSNIDSDSDDDKDNDKDCSNVDSASISSSQSLEQNEQSIKKKSVLEVMERSIESEIQNEFEDLESRQGSDDVKATSVNDTDMDNDKSNLSEKFERTQVKNIKNNDVDSQSIEHMKTESETQQSEIVDKQILAKNEKSWHDSQISSGDKSEDIETDDNNLEKPKSADGQDTSKDQSKILQSKLKKAMESLSNVKSLLVAKHEAAKLKSEPIQNESSTASDLEAVHSKEQNIEIAENSAKDSESVSGNLSDLEDHNERRNIFDVMMKDYQSPNKDGKTSDRSEEHGDEKECSLKMSAEYVNNEKSDGKLLDIGLQAKSKKESDNLNEVSTDDKIDESKSDQNWGESESPDLLNSESNTCKVEDTPLMNELLEKNCSSSPLVLSDDDGNDSDIQIIKVQEANESDNEKEDEKEEEKMTIADKLIAKFKKWEEEENNLMKTPTKQPLKLKITSSPDKSIIVSSHGRKKKTNMRKVDGRFVSMYSTQREIKEPLPMDVLLKPEREVRDSLSAFHSEYLDNFLIHQNSVEADNEDDEDDDEEEEDENEDDDENLDDNMSDMSMDENEPDFEEIDGILFMSFPSKNALNAHVHVERRTKLGTDENMLLGMARMRNLRRKQGYLLSKYNKKVGNEFFKKQDNISQNLRGMHKTLAKYQRLYKQELYWLDHPQDCSSSSRQKTNDITKIKGWKNKVGSVNDDVEQAKAEIENGGKLHWRTEARLAKNLKPDELKEIGLKRKRRKNIIYTQRKGMSKGDRSMRTDNLKDDIEDDISRGGGSPIQFVDDEVEMLEGQADEMDDSQMIEKEDIGEEDDAIVFDPDDTVQDEELIRIQERELLKEDEHRKTRERNRIIFKTTMLKKRMNYNLQDIQVIRKLGGHNIRRRKNADGEYKGDYIVMDEKGSRPSTPDMTQQEEVETPSKRGGARAKETTMMIITSNMAIAASTALSKQFVRKKPKTKEILTTPTRSPDPGQAVTCDKPDTASSKNESCRYGCICHLCMFTEQSPEADQRVVKCEKEYCRLGCICDSIEGRKDKGKLTNCGKPGCAPECTCDDLSSNKKRCEKYDKDYVPSVQKGNPKYAALPRRESTYRLAKNLDAVSRKALLYYESSEMYADQKKARRRRSKDSLESAPQVYMDVDIDDYEPEQFQTDTAPTTRLEAQLKKPTPFKPKSLMTTGAFKQPKKDMTDFSNIRSEISSQGSWNVDELSDEYEGVEILSDDESSTCARTTVYNIYHRDKHCASGCTCGSEKFGTKHSTHEDGKFNIPKEILLSGKWHTQWICLRSKGHSVDDKYLENLRLLEVISNCDYEDMKAKILSSLTTCIALSNYPPLRTFNIGNFCVSILPKSNSPAIIPPEVKAKLPDSVYSIRVQIIKQPKTSKRESPVINLTNDNDDDVIEVKAETKKKKKEIAVKAELHQSELAKRLQSAPSSTSIVPGGISGLSRLQISCPTGQEKNSSEQNLVSGPVIPKITTGQVFTVVDKSKIPPGSVLLVPHTQTSFIGSTTAINISQPINVAASSSNTTGTSVTSMANQSILLVQESSNVLKGNTVGMKTSLVGVPLPGVGSTSVVGSQGDVSNTNAVAQPIHPKHTGNVLKPETQQQQVISGQINDGQAKRKASWQAVNSDVKKSKVDSSLQGVEGQGIIAQPIPLPGDPLEPVAVLRCVRCNTILTTEDITSWVLSQDSISEKICVKCRGVKPNIVQPKIITQLSRAGHKGVGNSDTSMNKSSDITKSSESPCIDLTDGSELIKSVEDEANKIRNIVHDVDDSSITSLECSKSDSSSQNPVSEPIIDLSDENNDELKADDRKNSADETESNIVQLKTEKCTEKDNKDKSVLSKVDDSDVCAKDSQSAKSSQSSDTQAEGDISLGNITKVSESKPEGSDKDINLKADTEDEYEAAVLDAQDEDNIAHSLSDDDMQDAASQKSNVIVIEDEDDGVTAENEKNMEEEDDIDVTSFSETDTINIVPDSDPLPTSKWHSRSCSLNNITRRKRKAELDIIYNSMVNQVEIRENHKHDKSADVSKKSRKENNRKMRLEEHNQLKNIASVVLPGSEALPGISKTAVLDKALEFLRAEVPKTKQLENKVKTFKQYQEKLQSKLEDLKDFHIQRGISKEKLDFQLDKIAVVCDRIYDHLPEIKQHIKSKKEGDGTPQQKSPRPARIVGAKTPPHVAQLGQVKPPYQNMSQRQQARKGKRTKSLPKVTDVYIDNPEDYDKGSSRPTTRIATGTSLSSLPGTYSSPVHIRPKPTTANMVSQPVIQVPMRVVRCPISSVQNTPSFVQTPIRAVGPTVVNVPVGGIKPAVQSLILEPQVIKGTSYYKGVNQLVTSSTGNSKSSNVQSFSIPINVPSSPIESLPVLLEDSVTSLSSLSQKTVSTSSSQQTDLKKSSEAHSSRQQSPTDFRSIIGKIIQKNVIESQDEKDSTGSSSLQQSQAEKHFENNFPSFDENLLKDQILDDTTGEIINVVLNDEGNENSNSSEKNSECSNTSEVKDHFSEASSNDDDDLKSMEVEEISNNLEKTLQEDEKTNSKSNEAEAKDDEPNIESLLDDIRALSQEDDGDAKISPSKSFTGVDISKQAEIELSCTETLEDKKLDQVDGGLFNLPDNKEIGNHGNLSDADSNNSARTNVYMEDSDGNVSIAGDIDDNLGMPRSPKVVSVMSISDVIASNLSDVDDTNQRENSESS